MGEGADVLTIGAVSYLHRTHMFNCYCSSVEFSHMALFALPGPVFCSNLPVILVFCDGLPYASVIKWLLLKFED
jgi:hypothetical protein